MPIYEVKSRGKRYDIPPELKDNFLKRNPDAQELYTPELVNNGLPKKEAEESTKPLPNEAFTSNPAAKDMEVFDPTSLKELSKNTERFGLDGSPIRDVSVPEQAKGFLLNKDQAERVKERKSEHEQQNRFVLDQIEEFGHSLPESSYFDGESGRDYSTAKNYLYDAKKLKDRSAYRKGHGAVAQFLDAAGSELRDSEVLTMGGKEIDNALRVKSIIDKLEESKDDLSSLTDSERAVLRAAAIRQAAEEVYSNEQSISQRAGSATTGSVPFMIQYGLTSGFGAGAKTAVTKYVQSGLNRLISKGLLGKAVTKYVPKVAGATTQAAIMTPLQPGTYANIFNRRIGPADYGIDGSGDIEYQGHNSQTSTMEAMYKGITSSAIENFSEMTGAGFSQLGGDVFKLFSKQVPGLGRVFSKIPKSELMSRISKMTKRVGWNGTVEEFLEEQPATFLNALLVADNEFSDLIDLEQQATIAVSVAAMGAGFTGLNEAGSVYEKRKIKNEYVNKREQFRTVFAESAPETIEMIESVISDCTPDRLVGTLNVLEQNVELTPEQSDVMRGYAVQSIVYNSLQKGYQERIIEERKQAEQEIREQVNPDMDAIVMAETSLGDARIVGGNLVLDEKGEIDRSKSSKTIYIETEAERKAIPLFFVNRIVSNTPVEDALLGYEQQLKREQQQEKESINFNVQPGHTIWIGQDAIVRSVSPDGIYKIQLLDDVGTVIELSEQQLRDEMRKFEPDPVLESLPETASDVGVAETVLSETDKVQEHPVVFSTGKNSFEGVKREDNTGELNSIFESEKSAKAVYSNLSALYPNLNFTVENRTDRNDPMARAQYAVSFKAAPSSVDYSGLPAAELGAIVSQEFGPKAAVEELQSLFKAVEKELDVYEVIQGKSIEERTENRRRKQALEDRINEISEAILSFSEKELEGERKPEEITIPEKERQIRQAEQSESIEEVLDVLGDLNEQEGLRDSLQEWQKQLIGRRVNRKSFVRFADKNMLSKSIARSWLNSKNNQNHSGNIDIIAQELSEFGIDVTPQDVVDFIVRYPNNYVRKTSAQSKILENRFSELASNIAGVKILGPESATGRAFIAGLNSGKVYDSNSSDYIDNLDSDFETDDNLYIEARAKELESLSLEDAVRVEYIFAEGRMQHMEELSEIDEIINNLNHGKGSEKGNSIETDSDSGIDGEIGSGIENSGESDLYRGLETEDRAIEEESGELNEIRFRSSNETNSRFNEELERQIDGELPQGHIYQLGLPSQVLIASGIPNLPIELSAERLSVKSSEDYKSNHPFDLKSVENLPDALANPIAVFDSTKGDRSKVVLTELRSGENHFVAVLRVAKNKDRGRQSNRIDSIRSVYPKDNKLGVLDWVNSGLLKWVDKKKANEFIAVQWPNYIADGNKHNSLTSAANVIQNFENQTLLQGNIVSEIEMISEELNTPVRLVRSIDEIGGDHRKRSAKGWYDIKSDQVVIMLSNATSVSDVQATMLHEIVGHKGLRGLLGDSFDSFLDHVYDSLPESERTRIAESGDIRVGTEEYLATLAEQDVSPSVWQKISSTIREFFRDVLRINLTLSDADLKYMLWKSKKRLTSQDTISDMVSKAVADGTLKERLFRDTERLDIETQARESGRWLLAPNSMPTLLNPESWITARTKGFNEWFGDWEKAARIEKLRNSEYIVLPEAEYALNRESAQRYALDRLRGEYTIKDTGERVEVRKEGVKKVTSHSMGNETHLRSIQSIPDLLENAIFICELPNSKNNGKYDSYRYYCCGVKMGDTDYTAKVTVGVKGGKKYYDHALTEIEKGKLIDNIDGLTSPFDGNQFTSSDYKDSKLFEILQTNSSKNVDVNGEPLSEMIAEYEKDSNIRFREVAETRTAVKAEYERRTSGLGFRLNEAHVDNMGSLKILQNIIEKESGKKIEDWENPYMNVTAIPSKSQAEAELFMDRFFTPIVQEIAGLEKAGEGYENIINYLLAKSGIERNEVFSRRDAEEWAKEEIGKLKDSDDWSDQESLIRNKAESVYKENLKRDYAGLTALQEELGDVSVEDFISEFEGRHETNRFWKYIKNATNEILNISYRSGEISKELRDQLSDRMQYYAPMRGFDEKIAGDVYEYFNSSDGGGKEKKAKGRVSKADDPVATIAKMAESAIVKGNKNILKQQFMNMARNHPTDLCSINRVWYVNRGTVESPHWVIEYPEYNTDVDIMADNVIAFEQQMRELEKNQMAYPDKSKLATGLKISPRQAQEHEIVVREAGKEYVIYVNGSPRVAQAVNGLLNPDQGEITELKKSEAANRISRYSENAANRAVHILDNKGHYYKALQRQLAANFTTRNPDFIASNLCRDMIWATTSLSVKEGAFYTGHFLSNVPKASGAILRHLRGKSDMSRQEDKYFNEFAMNGGRTGYAALHNIDEFKRETKRKIQKINGKVDPIKAFRIATRFFSKGNVWAEDMSRFSTYMTSRQAGRSIQQSVSDAKEVTVNFNRKGSGGAGNATMKTLFLFYNAAIQSLNQFAKLYKKNPAGMTAVVMGFSILGYLVALMNDAVDDEDKYSNLPDWIRHNNLCIPAGVGFVTNPLSIELRAFYGVGEMLYQYQAGRMEDKNITLEMLKKITELTPVDPFGGEQSFWPDVIKPLVQIKDNKNFFGRRIYNNSYNEFQPGFRKALSGTNGFLVNSAELLNEASGGDFGTPGLIDINPAIVEHLIESYAGGLGKFINRTYKTAGALVDLATGDEVSLETKDMPVVNRFYNISEDGDSYKVNERYYQLLDDMKRFNSQRRSYIEKIDLGEVEYDDKLNVLLDSEGEKFDLIKSYKKEIDSLMKSLEDVSEQEQTEIKNDALELKRQLIEELKD